MVELVACGKTDEEVADTVGYEKAFVAAIRRSPMFQVEVRDTQEQLRTLGLKAFAERMTEELLPSLNTMVTIREGAADVRDKLAAADKIIKNGIDMFVTPRKRDRDDDDKRTTKIIVEGTDLNAVIAALREAGGSPPAIDVSPAQVALISRPALRPITLEEFEEQQLREQEAYSE